MRRKLTRDRYRVDVASLLIALVVGMSVGLAASCHVAEEEATAPEPDRDAALDEVSDGADDGGGPSFAAKTTERVDRIREQARDCCPARDDRPPPEVDPALTDEERVVRARELFMEGLEAFDAGDYVRAAEAFEASYAHAPDQHVLAYNIGKAWQGAGDCCRTRRAMLRFLELGPEDPAGEMARELVDGLECSACL